MHTFRKKISKNGHVGQLSSVFRMDVVETAFNLYDEITEGVSDKKPQVPSDRLLNSSSELSLNPFGNTRSEDHIKCTPEHQDMSDSCQRIEIFSQKQNAVR